MALFDEISGVQGKTSGVPVCTTNFCCALTNVLPSAVKILAIGIIINAQDHDRPFANPID